jgi:hypothetical protein
MILPEIYLFLIAVLQRIAAFENQRWVRQRQQGITGSSEAIGILVDFVMPVGTILWYAFLLMYAIDVSFVSALLIWLGTTFSLMVYGLISGKVFGDNVFIWMLGTILTLPIGIYLLLQTTIFGLL